MYLLSMASACIFLRLHVAPRHIMHTVPASKQSSTVSIGWSSWRMALLLTLSYASACRTVYEMSGRQACPCFE